MTNPTPLSPAAQAVVTAIEKFDWESGHFTREDIWMLSREVTAAALRELVGSNAYEVEGEGWYSLVIDVDDIYAIADELEGAQ